MTRRKYKSTGCFRFLLVIIVLIPAAYFGAKAIRGGEGIPVVERAIDNIFNGNDDVKPIEESLPQNEVERLRDENKALRDRIDQLERRIEDMQNE